MLSALITFFLVGLAAIVVVGIALALIGLIFGAVFSLAGFLLFKVAPIVLVGYLIVRFLAPRRARLEPADRKWLEE
jgi:predicted lipid-binding transport protein (Tim44 family)